MVRINFNLRETTPGKLTPIRVLVRWSGHTLKYSSGERIDPRNWSDTTQRAKKNLTGNSDLNMRLTNVQQGIEKAYRATRERLERIPTSQELREAIDAEVNGTDAGVTPDLITFIQEFIERSRNRINPANGKQMAVQTIKNYHTTLSHLREFLKHKRGRIEFTQIDLVFYDRLNAFLSKEKGLALNTVGKTIQTLKAFIRAAEEAGIEVNPVYRTKRFKTPRELTDKVYLTEEELNELYHLDLSNDQRLERVRDLFLIGAWTGLRFSDFTTVKPEHIQDDSLRIRTQKTGQVVEIPLHPTVRAIIAKYNGNLPRAISNQKMNDYLKEITVQIQSLQYPVMLTATVAGERKTTTKRKFELITTHTARRSFATNLYKAGCPARSIMAITCHQTEAAFRAYIRLNGEEHANIVRMFMKPLSTLAAVK
jgi:integrase